MECVHCHCSPCPYLSTHHVGPGVIVKESSRSQLKRQEKRHFGPHVNLQIVMVARLQERQPDPNLYWPDHLSQIRSKMYLCILQL